MITYKASWENTLKGKSNLSSLNSPRANKGRLASCSYTEIIDSGLAHPWFDKISATLLASDSNVETEQFHEKAE